MEARGLLLAVALALAPLAGCMTPAEGGPSGSIPFETIDRGPDSGIEERDTVVVRDQQSWAKLWDRHAPDDERPQVNFDEEIVAAIFKGQSPDGCHGAEIEDVVGEENRIRVEAAFYEVTDAYCTQQITHPFHIVAFERHDAEVVFDVTEETRQRGGDDNDTTNETNGSEGSGEPAYTCREPSEASEELAATENVTFETLDEGEQSGIEEPCVTVAANETAWRDLWRDHYPTSTADDERPEVNFEENLVVAIFKGESPDACHDAEIEEITRDGLDLVVHGVFSQVQGQSCAEVVTYPYHIAEVERPEGEVRFDIRQETRSA